MRTRHGTAARSRSHELPITAWLAIVLALALQLGSCRQADSASAIQRPSILLISIDTLRPDHLGCYGYSPYAEPVSPTIDGLAREGVRATRCYAPRGQTAPSLCSMMTGKYPSAHGVRENGQDFIGRQETLMQRLEALGYETGAFISRLPAARGGHPAQGASTLVVGKNAAPDGRHVSQQESDDFVTRRSIAWLRERTARASGDAEPAPFLAWVHFYGVHKPYTPPAPYDTLFSADYDGPLLGQDLSAAVDGAALRRERLAPREHRYVLSQYDGEIRYVDDRVAELLKALDELGLASGTIVILTADHGEELADHQGYYYHGNSVYHGVLHVPLIFRWPGHLPAGVELDELVQNVDILPTLLDWLGEALPADIEGVSLAPWLASEPPQRAPRQYAYSEWQNLIYGIRDDEHSYVFNRDGVHPRKTPFYGTDLGFRVDCDELYDIRADPAESENLYGLTPELEGRLRKALLEHGARADAVSGWQVLESEELLEHLRALGYVGTQSERLDVLFDAEACAR